MRAPGIHNKQLSLFRPVHACLQPIIFHYAAVAARQGVSVREVDIRSVQDILAEQNVPLPRNSKTDPAYTECCEAHEYGLYTELAARAKKEGIEDYRQW